MSCMKMRTEAQFALLGLLNKHPALCIGILVGQVLKIIAHIGLLLPHILCGHIPRGEKVDVGALHSTRSCHSAAFL